MADRVATGGWTLPKLVEASLDSRDMSVWFVSHAIGKPANRKLCPRKAKPKHRAVKPRLIIAPAAAEPVEQNIVLCFSLASADVSRQSEKLFVADKRRRCE